MNMIFRHTEATEQRVFSLTIGALISYMPINTFLNKFLTRMIGMQTYFDTLLCYFVLYVLIFQSIMFIYKRIKTDISASAVILLIVWFASYLNLDDANAQYMFTRLRDIHENPFYRLFLYSFSGYVFVRYIYDYNIFKKTLKIYSIVVVLCSVITFFLTLSEDYQEQYMVFSYDMLIHSTFLILLYFEEKKIINLIIGIIGIVMIFIAGSRGAMASFMLCMFVYVLFRKTKSTRKVLLVIVSLVALFFVLFYFEEILNYMDILAERLGINSRTLTMMREGELFNDSGRSEIQEKIISNFNFFGHGLYAERFFDEGSSYAHNLIIEIIYHFGYFFGIPILLCILWLLLNGVFAKNAQLRFLVIVFMSAGLFKLFFSGSYLHQEPSLYIMLGLCVNASKKRRC